jgi:hypothetical protein
MLHSKKDWAKYDQKLILVFMQSTHFSCPILMKLKFFHRFSKNTRLTNSTKIRPVGAEFFHVDKQTDGHDELMVAFRNFGKASKKQFIIGVVMTSHT